MPTFTCIFNGAVTSHHYYFFYKHTVSWRHYHVDNHHVRNTKNLNHKKLPLSTTKTHQSTTIKTSLHPYQWSSAADHVAPHGQLLPFSPVLRFYRPVLHVERNARTQTRLRAQRRVALAPVSESNLNCS